LDSFGWENSGYPFGVCPELEGGPPPVAPPQQRLSRQFPLVQARYEYQTQNKKKKKEKKKTKKKSKTQKKNKKKKKNTTSPGKLPVSAVVQELH